MNKIPTSTIMECAQRFWSDESVNRTLRMGQFLMNELVPTESNHHLFYDLDNNRALLEFIKTYGEDQD